MEKAAACGPEQPGFTAGETHDSPVCRGTFRGRGWGAIAMLVLAHPVLVCSRLHALELPAQGQAVPVSGLADPSTADPARVESVSGTEMPLEASPSSGSGDEMSDESSQIVDPADESSQIADPELGILRLHVPSSSAGELGDPELGRLRIWSGEDASVVDEELGLLRLRDREVEQSLEQPPAPPTVYLFTGVNYFRSNNIFLDDLDPANDHLISGRISLGAFPVLDPNTLMVLGLGGTVSLYGETSDLNYADLNARVGVRHFFAPRTYAELAWTHQALFSLEDGDRFLSDNSIRFTLARRDFLAPRLLIDSFYQLRWSVANPTERSRITHTLGVYAGYNATDDLQVSLGYQLLVSAFTEEDRDDTYHQLLAQMSYDLSRQVQINVYGGFSFGRSSSPDVSFDSTIFGASIDVSVPLF